MLRPLFLFILLFSALTVSADSGDKAFEALSNKAYANINDAHGLNYAQQLFTEASKAHDLKWQAKAKLIEAKYYDETTELPRMEEKVRPIMDWLKSHDAMDDYFHVWIYLILKYNRASRFVEANALINQMYEDAATVHSPYGLQGAYRMKGYLHKGCLAYGQAKECFRKEMEYAREVKSKTLYTCYYNMAICELMTGNVDKALQLCDEGFTLTDRAATKNAFTNLRGLAYAVRGDYAHVDSIYDLMRGYHSMSAIGDDLDAIWIFVCIAHMWGQGQFNASKRMIKMLTRKRQLQVMPAFYSRQGQYKEALKAKDALSVYADSLNSSLAISDMNQFAIALRGRLLYEENQRVVYRVQLITGIFIGTLLLVIVAVLIWLQRRQRRRNEFLKQERDNKDRFIQDMSHEIRTPLHQISGFAQILTDTNMELSATDRHDIVESINMGTAQLTNVLNSMLELYNVQNLQKVELAECDASHIVYEAVESVSNSNFDVEVRVGGMCSEPHKVTTNEAYVVRLLRQLINNAFKFTAKGYVEIGFTPKGKGVSFYVEDTGPGIPPDKREAIFDRFVKLDRYQPGLGLGLTLAREIAIKIGGKLTIDDSYKNGSRFLLTI